MQFPNSKTPVSKCLDLGAHGARMLTKFPEIPALAPLAAQLQSVSQALSNAQTSYADAVKAILPHRVDVKYENFVSDRRIRLTQQKAEIADGARRGLISKQAFPEGSAPIVRLIGKSQVEAMAKLAGRLAALAPLWPEAQIEAEALTALHKSYDAAIEGRTRAGQIATNLRAVRNVAKETFLNSYAAIASRVAAEFPRDTVMQDLFFDDVRSRSTAAQADDPDGEPSSEGDEAALVP